MSWWRRKRRSERIEIRGGRLAGVHYFNTADEARSFFEALTPEAAKAAEWRHWGTSRAHPEIAGKFWTFVADYYTTTDLIGTFG